MFAIVWDMDFSDTWIGMKYNGNKKGDKISTLLGIVMILLHPNITQNI